MAAIARRPHQLADDDDGDQELAAVSPIVAREAEGWRVCNQAGACCWPDYGGSGRRAATGRFVCVCLGGRFGSLVCVCARALLLCGSASGSSSGGASLRAPYMELGVASGQRLAL